MMTDSDLCHPSGWEKYVSLAGQISLLQNK